MTNALAVPIITMCTLLGQVDERQADEQARKAVEGAFLHAVWERARKEDPSPFRSSFSGSDPTFDRIQRQMENGEIQPIGKLMQEISMPDMGVEPPSSTPSNISPVLVLIALSILSVVSWLVQKNRPREG